MRIALVGLGNAGHQLHLPALARIEGVEVVGGCDIDPGRRDRAAKRWSVPVYAEYERMLDRARAEAVIVATPPDTHAEYIRKALAAGAHVISEKPFVSSLEEADEIIQLARAAQLRVALNHEFREMPIFRALREALLRPDVGEVVFAQVWQLMDLPPWAEPGWRGQMIQRTLYEAGVHLVDFLVALFGEKPLSVQCTTSTCGVREGESDAVALVTLEFSRGRLAHVTQDRLCKGPTHYFDVRADTRSCSLRASFGGRARMTAGLYRSTRPRVRLDFGISGMAWREAGEEREILARNPRDPAMIATQYVLEKTIHAFQNGGAPPASAVDARDVMEVIAASYHSAREGRRVRMDSDEVRKLAGLRLGHAA